MSLAAISLSTKDIGRIWTDKTVSEENITLSGDIGSSVTIDKETSADFLVGLSALGSAADITDVTKVPTDTVFVLDLSNNMWEDDQINTMIQAANEALKTLLNANPQNRWLWWGIPPSPPFFFRWSTMRVVVHS